MKVTYLNTTLHLAASYDLRPLVQALEALGFWGVSMEQTTDGRWFATLQAAFHNTSPEAGLKSMLSVLETLEDAERDLWMGCTVRDFDVCFACGSKRITLRPWLSRETSRRIGGVHARLRITLQTSNVWGEAGTTRSRAPTRRIVSLREYLSRIGKREAKRWGSIGLAAIVGAIIAVNIICFFGMLFLGSSMGAICALLALISLPLAWNMKKYAEKTMNEAQKKLDVVPLTRANLGDLPASHTLVRASQAPDSSPQAELLRAAEFGNETPAAELLRATQAIRQENLNP